jgi:amidase
VTQLHDLTALEQAAAVRAREASPIELVEHALRRIEALDAGLGAFLTVTPERARPGPPRRAPGARGRRPAPAARRPDRDQGPQQHRRRPTTFGCTVFADNVPTVDDAV